MASVTAAETTTAKDATNVCESAPAARSEMGDSTVANTENPSVEAGSANVTKESCDAIVNERLASSIHAMDEKNAKGKKKSAKKESTAVIKVKQMKMKSQAKGDTKRVKLLADRFYLELVTSRDDRSSSSSSSNNKDKDSLPIVSTSSIIFAGQNDSLDRVFRENVEQPVGDSSSSSSSPWKWEFLTPSNEDSFQRVQGDKTLKELECSGQLMNFGRLIVLFTK